MSEAKHTPGPWVIDRHGQLTGSNGKPVRECGSGISWIMTGGDDEARANATLRNTAPELLKALEGVLSAAEHAYHTAVFADPDGGDWWERIKNARAAIAKATGADQ